MKIRLQTKKENEMRYSDTAGDYYEKGNVLMIDVCKQENKDFEFMIMVHELIEAYLTKRNGIEEVDITNFDKKFEEERKKGKHGKFDEPGEDKRAPYYDEHEFATYIEKFICLKLGYNWNRYNSMIKCSNVTPLKISKKLGK